MFNEELIRDSVMMSGDPPAELAIESDGPSGEDNREDRETDE